MIDFKGVTVHQITWISLKKCHYTYSLILAECLHLDYHYYLFIFSNIETFFDSLLSCCIQKPSPYLPDMVPYYIYYYYYYILLYYLTVAFIHAGSGLGWLEKTTSNSNL